MLNYFVKAWLSILLLAAATTVYAGEDEIIVAIDQFLYGASVNDATIHDQFWAEELIYTSSSGSRFGKTELMAGMEGTMPTSEENVTTWFTASNPHINYVEGVAIANFVLVASNPAGEVQNRYYNTGVFVFRDMRWQAINWNATLIPE
ncbi:nuclear transport factor 2 family protein [Aliidiomarina sp.]|uniref:nuclear transport factor 2 family protein n=1 Tax=Aliidiomarina sp. TaxID=1872439 RepID=UPI003A4D8580